MKKNNYLVNKNKLIADLHEKLKKDSYRPMPVKRKYIPKAGVMENVEYIKTEEGVPQGGAFCHS